MTGSSQMLARLLRHEVNVGSLIGYFVERDPSPLQHFLELDTPIARLRAEVPYGGRSRMDVVLDGDGGPIAVLELKVAATEHGNQLARYLGYAHEHDARTVIADLEPPGMDEAPDGWKRVGLDDLFGCWASSANPAVSAFSREVAAVFHDWRMQVAGPMEFEVTQPIPHGLLGIEVPASLNRTADRHYQSGRFSPAATAYTRAIKALSLNLNPDVQPISSPNGVLIELLLAEGYYNRANAWDELGAYPHPLEDYASTLACDNPMPWNVRRNRALVYEKLGWFAEAQRDLSQALEDVPENAVPDREAIQPILTRVRYRSPGFGITPPPAAPPPARPAPSCLPGRSPQDLAEAGVRLLEQARASSDPGLLDTAVATLEQAVAATPAGHPTRPGAGPTSGPRCWPGSSRLGSWRTWTGPSTSARRRWLPPRPGTPTEPGTCPPSGPRCRGGSSRPGSSVRSSREWG